MNIEEVLSVSEQIQNIKDKRDDNDPESKLYLIIKQQYNPFK